MRAPRQYQGAHARSRNVSNRFAPFRWKLTVAYKSAAASHGLCHLIRDCFHSPRVSGKVESLSKHIRSFSLSVRVEQCKSVGPRAVFERHNKLPFGQSRVRVAMPSHHNVGLLAALTHRSAKSLFIRQKWLWAKIFNSKDYSGAQGWRKTALTSPAGSRLFPCRAA